MKKLILTTLLVLSLSPAPARSGNQAVWLYGGAEGGRMGTKVGEFANESSKQGWIYGLNVAPSYYHSQFVVDLGTHWFYSKISGENKKGRKSTVITRAGGVFISPRYTFSDYQFQIGPRFDFLFGTDVSFSPVENPNEKLMAWMGGLEAVYELPIAPILNLRVIGRYAFDLNIEDRDVWAGFLGFQMGIPLYARSEELEKEIVKVVGEKQVSVALGLELINFAFDSAEIPPKSLEFVKRIANFLEKNSKLWSKFEVEGHTDIRGSYDYNMSLSQRRAEAVRAALIKNGISESRVTAKGFGFTRPLLNSQTERAYAKNRRVELRFSGVNDPKFLESGVEEARDEVYGKVPQ